MKILMVLTQIGPLMLEVQKKLHILGRTGPLFYGISAIDVALWDIATKAAGASKGDLLILILSGMKSFERIVCPQLPSRPCH